MKKLITLLSMLALLAPARATIVKVNSRNFTSEPTQRRRITMTLTTAGPVVQAPWLIAGDAVSQYTDTNGVCYFSNALAGIYRLDIAGSPGRSFPMALADSTNYPTVIDAANLINSTNSGPYFYTSTQVDALLATQVGGTATNAFVGAAGGLLTITTNAAGSVYTINLTTGAVESVAGGVFTNSTDGPGVIAGNGIGTNLFNLHLVNAVWIDAAKMTSGGGNKWQAEFGFKGDGTELNLLQASNVSGTLASGAVSNSAGSRVAYLSDVGSSTTDSRFTSTAGTITAASNTLAATTISATTGSFGTVAGSGSGLTALNASQLASGTVPEARSAHTLTNFIQYGVEYLYGTGGVGITRSNSTADHVVFNTEFSQWPVPIWIGSNGIVASNYFGRGMGLTNSFGTVVFPTNAGLTGQYLMLSQDGLTTEWSAAVGSGDMLAANNLAELVSKPLSRHNLGADSASNLTNGTLALARLDGAVLTNNHSAAVVLPNALFTVGGNLGLTNQIKSGGDNKLLITSADGTTGLVVNRTNSSVDILGKLTGGDLTLSGTIVNASNATATFSTLNVATENIATAVVTNLQLVNLSNAIPYLNSTGVFIAATNSAATAPGVFTPGGIGTNANLLKWTNTFVNAFARFDVDGYLRYTAVTNTGYDGIIGTFIGSGKIPPYSFYGDGGGLTNLGGYSNVSFSASGATFSSNVVVQGNQTVNGNTTNTGTYVTTVLSYGYGFATNLWTTNSTVGMGTNYTTVCSANTGGGITGVVANGVDPTREWSSQIVLKSTGDIVFTNPVAFTACDGLDSRTFTNGNVTYITITVIPGFNTNLTYSWNK